MLPILMTITMVLQTRMNPVPRSVRPVMQVMPFVFSIFFFFFPRYGPVLPRQQDLSILQQWRYSACSIATSLPWQEMR
jgi:YidC/Oxa1 family membrane protein insertase